MRMLSVLLAVSMIPVLAGCGLGGPAHDDSIPAGVDAVVEMTSTLDFAPASVTVPVGGTVEWRNTSIMSHTVTADPGPADSPASVRLPEGAQPFDSGDIPPGQIYRRTFTVPGEYRYFCIPHEESGMIGTVIVQPAG